MDLFQDMPTADVLASREQRVGQAQEAGFEPADSCGQLIRDHLQAAGVIDDRHADNAVESLLAMKRATCFVKGPNQWGTGMLVWGDEPTGLVVCTANHVVPDDGAAEETTVFFDYEEDFNLPARSFPVTLEGWSPSWATEDEIDQHHMDFSLLRVVVTGEEDGAWLRERAQGRSFLMNPVSSHLVLEDDGTPNEGVLRQLRPSLEFQPLFMWSHPLGLAARLSAGRVARRMSADEHGDPVHLLLDMPHLGGSSGGNVLLCPPTGAEYKHWWAELMCSGNYRGHCLAVKWSAILR